METKQPLLSICIPTYNRAHVLKDCLKTLVQADGFCNDVEVIISDNCSTDETQQVCEAFSETYQNIKYFRNDSNIGAERNVLHVLEIGSGAFLKLSNDYNLFKKDSISFLLKTIKKHLHDKPVLYFHNHIGKGKTYETSSFDDFFCYETLGFGWISNYGYWKEDFDNFENKDAYLHTLFPQIDWFVRSYIKRRKIFCYNAPLFINECFRAPTGSYNFIEAHTINFFIPLNTLCEQNLLCQASLEKVKKYSLYYCTWMMVRSILANKKYYRYDSHNGWNILKEQFGRYAWYKKTLLKGIVLAFIKVPFEMIGLFMKRLWKNDLITKNTKDEKY